MGKEMRKLAESIPPMPDDWWPERIMVIGRHGDCELAFSVPGQLVREQRGLTQDFDGLRLSMWQAIAARSLSA